VPLARSAGGGAGGAVKLAGLGREQREEHAEAQGAANEDSACHRRSSIGVRWQPTIERHRRHLNLRALGVDERADARVVPSGDATIAIGAATMAFAAPQDA